MESLYNTKCTYSLYIVHISLLNVYIQYVYKYIHIVSSMYVYIYMLHLKLKVI